MPIIVNRGSIMQKVKSHIASPSYQSAVNKEIKRRREGNIGGADLGVNIITEAQMRDAASILRKLLYSVAASAGVPGSVLEHIGDIESSGITYEDGDKQASITLSFVGDLSRPSLVRKDGSQSAGIKDIVTLFDQGYSYDGKRVFGYYENWGAAKPAGSDMVIVSRNEREGLFFLQNAIEEFNSIYGASYHCYAYM